MPAFQPDKDPIKSSEIWSAIPDTLTDQQLMFKKERLGCDSAHAARA